MWYRREMEREAIPPCFDRFHFVRHLLLMSQRPPCTQGPWWDGPPAPHHSPASPQLICSLALACRASSVPV